MQTKSSNAVCYIPSSDIRSFIKNTTFPLDNLGEALDTYSILQTQGLAPVNNTKEISISELTWLHILARVLTTDFPATNLVEFRKFLFAKLFIVEGEQEIYPIIDKHLLFKAPFFIDEVIHSICSRKQDILIKFYSTGAIEFTCSAGMPLQAEAIDGFVILTLSIHEALSAISGLQNVPRLKVNSTLITEQEMEIINLLRRSEMRDLKISINNQSWHLSATEYGVASKAEIGAMYHQLDGSDELHVKNLVNQHKRAYQKIHKRVIQF